MRTVLFGMLLLLAAAFAADRDLAGGYTGEWQSKSSGNSGTIRFTLEPAGDAWKGTAGFALDGSEVACTVRTLKVQDGKIELSYDFVIQDLALRSTQKGEWKAGEFHGTYETTTADGSQAIDAGTWSAKRKP